MSAVNPTILKTCVEGVLASAIKDYRDAMKGAAFSMEPGEATEIGQGLQRVLSEIDEIAEATLRSISLETMLNPRR